MSTEDDPKADGMSAAAKRKLDRESAALLYQGASIGQLALLFRRDKRTITNKITGKVEPCGMRGGFPIYAVADVAGYVVPPIGDFEEAIKNMHHEDIPPLLHKNYWAGKRERQAFEREEGLLVDVYDAAAVVAEAFKNARMSIMLMPDAIEREFVLSDEHRAAMKKLVDSVLEELQTNLVEAFAERVPEDTGKDHGPDGSSTSDEYDDIFGEAAEEPEEGQAWSAEALGGL